MDSPHGTEEQLELYALGRLGDPEKELLEEHLFWCGECLDRLESSEQSAIGIREALRMDPPPLVATAKPGSGWWGWLLRPAFLVPCAVALLAVFGFLFFQSLAIMAPVASLQLTALRGEMASVPPAREIDITVTDAPETGGPFRLEVVDGVGKQLWTGSGTNGQVKRSFSKGVYFVRLYTVDGQLAREYGFVVKK